MNQNTKKIVVIGSGGVGKTRMVRRFINGALRNKYIATLGVEVHPVKHNGYKFNMWDTAGIFKFGGLRDGYYIGANGAMCIIDIDNPESIATGGNMVAMYRNVCPGTQILIINITTQVIEEGVENTFNSVDNIPIEILEKFNN